MICSSSCDPANSAVASPHSDSHLLIRVWSPVDIATGTTNLILLLDQRQL
jgi:hypothetical protein